MVGRSNFKSILYLKDKHWKYGIKSQKKWFSRYVENQDIHNLLYIKTKLVGYTLLRKRTRVLKLNQKNEFLVFDTLVIDPNYRNLDLSKTLMDFNNHIIKQTKCISFLLCDKTLINFYKKNGWLKLNNKDVELKDHKTSKYKMIFNEKRKIRKKYIFYMNKSIKIEEK